MDIKTNISRAALGMTCTSIRPIVDAVANERARGDAVRWITILYMLDVHPCGGGERVKCTDHVYRTKRLMHFLGFLRISENMMMRAPLVALAALLVLWIAVSMSQDGVWPANNMLMHTIDRNYTTWFRVFLWQREQRPHVVSPLFMTVDRGRPHMAQMLLERGADPNEEDVLTLAAEKCDLQMTQLLLDHGAEIHFDRMSLLILEQCPEMVCLLARHLADRAYVKTRLDDTRPEGDETEHHDARNEQFHF